MEARNTTPSARTRDPWTSHVAAGSVQSAAVTHRETLLKVYADNPDGLTDEEACNLAGIPSAWRRCSELRALGLIEDTGRSRPQSSGRHGRVCRAVHNPIATETLFLMQPPQQPTRSARFW